MVKIRGVVFDKDGTLFDFHQTWGRWTVSLLEELSEGSPALAATLARAVGFDLKTTAFAADSPIIFATPTEIAQDLLAHLPGRTLTPLVAQMNALAATARPIEALPLKPYLQALRASGLKLGVVTNDGEEPALAHLGSVGVVGLFDFIAGFDSGHGAKPAPGPLLAFADLMGLHPSEVVMVGDSRHDLDAGRAAGMRTVAVLTGVADAQELSPLADVVLPDIGHLPGWLAGQD